MVVDKATRHVRLLIKSSENRTLSNENKYIRSSISTWYEYKLTYKNLQPPTTVITTTTTAHRQWTRVK